MTWNHYEENTRATPEELAMSGRGDDRLAEYGPAETSYAARMARAQEREKRALEMPDPAPSPFAHQVGGSHYKQYTIQPYEFFFKNNIPHHKAAIIRRILRYDHPTGKGLTDLQKIKHEVDLIIELQQKELSLETRESQTQLAQSPQRTTLHPSAEVSTEAPRRSRTPSNSCGSGGCKCKKAEDNSDKIDSFEILRIASDKTISRGKGAAQKARHFRKGR